ALVACAGVEQDANTNEGNDEFTASGSLLARPKARPCRTASLSDYAGRWAAWDASGGHLCTEEVLALRELGAGIFIFRTVERKGGSPLDLKRIKESGLIVIASASSNFPPFSHPEFLKDTAQVTSWATAHAQNPYVDAIGYNSETPDELRD